MTSDSEQGQDGIQSSRVLLTRAGLARSGLVSDSHQRQIYSGPNRAGRVIKPAVSSIPSRYTGGLDYSIPESHIIGGDDSAPELETDPGMFSLPHILISVHFG